MIKKEFKDILKPAALRVLSGVVIILLFFTALFIFGEKNIPYLLAIVDMFNLLFWFIILWVSYNLGINMFKSEQSDHAMEYLLATPIMKTKILFNKIVPRLGVLLFLLFIYFFIYHSNIFFNLPIKHLLEFYQILIFIFGIFFSAAFLSIYDWGNFKALVWLVILFPAHNLGLILDHFARMNIVEGNKVHLSSTLMNISLGIVLIILGIGFFFVFRNSDIRPQKILKNKYAFISIIPLALIVIVSLYFGIVRS